MSSTEIDAIVERVAAIAADWAGERAERQRDAGRSTGPTSTGSVRPGYLSARVSP